MLTCTKQFRFCAGHRLLNHDGPCAHLHGHNYLVEVTAAAPLLNDLGMVVDFQVLKDTIGLWIDCNWDHGFLFNQGDAQVRDLYWNNGPLKDLKHFSFSGNPTAENMARFLLEVVGPTLLEDTDITLCRVRVWETPTCFAEACR